jgi:hypothetical protein
MMRPGRGGDERVAHINRAAFSQRLGGHLSPRQQPLVSPLRIQPQDISLCHGERQHDAALGTRRQFRGGTVPRTETGGKSVSRVLEVVPGSTGPVVELQLSELLRTWVSDFGLRTSLRALVWTPIVSGIVPPFVRQGPDASQPFARPHAGAVHRVQRRSREALEGEDEAPAEPLEATDVAIRNPALTTACGRTDGSAELEVSIDSAVGRPSVTSTHRIVSGVAGLAL